MTTVWHFDDLRVTSTVVISNSHRTNPEKGGIRGPEGGQKGGQKNMQESQIQKNNRWISRNMPENGDAKNS